MSIDFNDEPAFIFDVDGVLIHSTPLHTESWRVYLDGLGLPAAEDLEHQMFGKRNSELVRDLIGADLSESEIFEHGAAKERLFREMMNVRIREFEVPGLADFLRNNRGVPKAVASNAEPANITFVLDNLGLRQYFPVIVDGHQVERPKPFPDIYLEAARQLKTGPKDCIVFEDSPTGITAAKAAGMTVVGVETTLTNLENVDFRIADFLDTRLESWLSSRNSVSRS